MSIQRIYGPVPSRRFGLSLGVDLVPFKVCSYDCVYCQVGRTTRLTQERQDFFEVADLLSAVQQSLARGPRPDVITLAGSGEPTLYRSLDVLIDGLHQLSDLPVLLLTNGSLLYQPEVARAALLADIVAPSLDAGDDAAFRAINRPHPELDYDQMLQGLRDIARQHARVCLEVMVVAGLNDSPDQLRSIRNRLDDMPIETIDVNTPVRPVPGRVGDSLACAPTCLRQACSLLGPRARPIADFNRGAPAFAQADALGFERLLALLRRRPCTLDDLRASLGLHPHEIGKMLQQAQVDGRVEQRIGGERVYYAALPDKEPVDG